MAAISEMTTLNHNRWVTGGSASDSVPGTTVAVPEADDVCVVAVVGLSVDDRDEVERGGADVVGTAEATLRLGVPVGDGPTMPITVCGLPSRTVKVPLPVRQSQRPALASPSQQKFPPPQ